MERTLNQGVIVGAEQIASWTPEQTADKARAQAAYAEKQMRLQALEAAIRALPGTDHARIVEAAKAFRDFLSAV